MQWLPSRAAYFQHQTAQESLIPGFDVCCLYLDYRHIKSDFVLGQMVHAASLSLNQVECKLLLFRTPELKMCMTPSNVEIHTQFFGRHGVHDTP